MSFKSKFLSKKNVIFIVCILALIALLFIIQIADPRVEFKDEGLEEAIRAALGNQNRPIYKDDLSSITLLDASNKDISSLDGIEHLKNLTFLNLENNNVEDISPLENLKKIKDLNLSNNSITDLEEINFRSIIRLPLIVLNLSHNVAKDDNGNWIKLSDINLLSYFSQLEELYLRDNHIEDISPLDNLNNLEILDLRGNLITDISPLKNITTIKELNLRENNVKDLTALSGLKNLIYLNIHSSKNIQSIEPISGLTNLKTLIMENVDRGKEIELLAGLTELKRLNMCNCSIPDISPISSLFKLEELNLRDNHIEDISALEKLVNLKILNLRDNDINDITALKNITTLKELNLRENNVKDLTALSEIKNLEYLNIYSNNNIISIESITDLTNLKTLIIQGVDLEENLELLNNFKNLNRLDLCNCSISDISFINKFNKLKELNLRDNHIKDISILADLVNLEILDLRGNLITDISPLKNITTLKELNLRENRIKDLSALSELENLEYLNIHSNNNIKSIEPISGLTNLKTLIMRNVNVGEEIKTLTKLVKLEILNIRNCNISYIKPLAELMSKGALQDDFTADKKTIINIRDNPIFTSRTDNFKPIRPYWHNIGIRAPFTLPIEKNVLKSPEFSHPGGFYKEGFLLKLNSCDPEVKIFYTLDGSEPTQSSDLYTGPIEIDSREGEPSSLAEIATSHSFRKPDGEIFKVTVVRARSSKDDEGTSSIVTKTYIIDEKNEGNKNRYSLPVISIATDARNLFDNNYGILVPGNYFYSDNADAEHSGNYFQKGMEWERPIHIEFYESDGKLGFSQNAGLRVQGGATRYYRNKSLRIYASDLYDEKDMFEYPIFSGLMKTNQNEPLTIFKSFILRNSGNDSYDTYFRDGMLQTLVSNLNFDTQAYRPAVVFINGEYWGIYNIRENFDDWYIATNYEVDRSDVVILNNHNLSVEAGEYIDRNHFLEMVQFIKENLDSGTINKPDVYEHINTLMDIDNFINYFASEIFFRNYDWPRGNIGFWRVRTESYEPDAPYGHDGRWRLMMFDVDAGFGLWDQLVSDNTLMKSAESNELFSLLLENDEFRYQFINTMADLINSIFRSEYIIQKIENTRSILAPEILEHLKRWNYDNSSIEDWNENIQVMVTFAKERPELQLHHLNKFFSLPGTVEINLITDTGKGYIKINSLELKEETPGIYNDGNWKGIYFKEVPVNITAIPNPGYEFSGWEGIDCDDLSITVIPEKDLALTANFTKKESD
jgi:Leucine-rich repeat (LRR) protein